MSTESATVFNGSLSVALDSDRIGDHEDPEIILSMVDDVARRLFVTLPELR